MLLRQTVPNEMRPAGEVRLRLRRGLVCASAALLVALAVCPGARGDVGVVLSESLGTGGSRFTSAGHSAVYLSNICPESPVKLRLCEPGEHGSIISNYVNFGETELFQWNVVPLNMFLYGVKDAADRPILSTEKIKAALEAGYAQTGLAEYCPGPPCTTNKNANWRDTVGSTLVRSIYVFVVRTTEEQDLELIERFNSAPNVNHFNGMTRNCADFTRSLVNSYFPGATRPNYINDFAITSPKGIARSFALFGKRQPEREYYVLHFAQVPGTYRRSDKSREGVEELFHAKKWMIPLAYLTHYEFPVFISTYVLLGRFNPQHELEKHSSPAATDLAVQIKAAKAMKDKVHVKELEAEKKQERARVVGEKQEWKQYRKEFDAMLKEAIRTSTIPAGNSAKNVFKQMDKTGKPVLDSEGALWMEFQEGGQTRRVGLSASNLLSPGSDSALAYKVLLAHVDRVLKSPSHSRESIPEFKMDWALLQRAHERATVSLAQVR